MIIQRLNRFNVSALLFSILALCSVGASALEMGIFEFRGFGTIGLLTHDVEDLSFHLDQNKRTGVYDQEVSLRELSRLGLQVDTRSETKFNFSAQIVLSDGYGSAAGDMIKLAALRYDPTTWLQFRVGRIKPRTFLLSDIKRLGFSQLWTMPVQEFYGLNPNEFLNGGEINMEHAIGPGYLKTNMVYGGLKLKGRERTGEENIIEFDDFSALNLDYELNAWTFRLGYTSGNIVSVENGSVFLAQQLTGAGMALGWNDGLRLANAIQMAGTKTQYTSAGLIYNDGVWEIQAEHYRIWGESKLVPDLRSRYLSVGYHVGKFTPYVLFATTEDKDDDFQLSEPIPPVPGIDLLAAGGLLAANSGTKQESFSIGLRYEVDTKSAVKLQVDRKKVGANGAALWTDIGSVSFLDSFEATVISTTYEFVF